MHRIEAGYAHPAVGRFLVLALGAHLFLGACRDQGPDHGSIVVSLFAVGEDVPDTGMVVRLNDLGPRDIPASGSATFEPLSPGEYSVRLGEIPANCTVAGANPRTVEIAAGERKVVRFDVECERIVGTLRVATTTQGDEPDLDGYLLRLDDGSEVPIGAGDQQTLHDAAPGNYALSLEGVAPNCIVLQALPRDVVVTFADTTDLGLTIDCMVSGSLAVEVDLGGEPLDTDGHSVRVRSVHLDSTVAAAEAEDVVIHGLRPGEYLVSLGGLTGGCDVAGEYPRVVTVVGGETVAASFDVTCLIGAIAYVSDRDGNAEIYLVSTDGTSSTRLTTNSAWDGQPAWSPDGTRISFTSLRDGDFEIYVMDATGANPVRLTQLDGVDEHPTWSPDGARIAFSSSRDGNAEIYVMNADGSNVVRVTHNGASDTEPAWSPLGDRIAFRTDRHGETEIYTIAPDGTNETAVTATPEPEFAPAWSPDGSRLAFARGHCDYYDCSRDLIVRDVNGTAELRFGRAGVGDDEPTWSPNGLRIAYVQFTPYYYTNFDAYTLRLIRPDGTDELVLVESNAYSPAWRP